MGTVKQGKNPDVYTLFDGGGSMGAQINAFDWSAHPLGKIEKWPQSLLSALSICLNSNFPIAIYWGKDLILLYNDAWSPIPGTKHPWALGKSAYDVWPDIWPDIKPLFDEAMTTGKATGSKDALLPMKRHGYVEECYFDFTFTPIYGESGKVDGIFNAVIETTYRVISERRANFIKLLSTAINGCGTKEKLLSALKKQLCTNFLDIPFSCFYSYDKGQWSKLIGVNDNGFDSSQLLQTLALDSVAKSPFYIKDLSAFINNEIKSPWPEKINEGCYVPITINGDLGGAFIFGVSSRLAYNTEYLKFYQEVSGLTESELQTQEILLAHRRRADELEALDKAKTLFFSNISHEFRTPLTLMLGPLEELLNKSKHLNEPEKAKLETAHRNALRLLRMVNTLLDFSRIESGRQKAAYVLTDIVQFTKNLSGNFQSVIEKAGLKFIVKADSFIQPVYIDKDMWEKIVFNLLSNAFKYTLEGSVTLSVFANGRNVVLKVTDTGVGIPKEELPNLFQRFHRVQNVTGRTFEGTGIGLSMIRELISILGGEISVESELGKGSSFEVRLPFGKDHIPKEQIRSSEDWPEYLISSSFVEEANTLLPENNQVNDPAVDPSKELILVVDDNADMREHLRSLLAQKYRVNIAANGMEALHKVSDVKPALILSDIMMPIMNGIDLVKELKNNTYTRHIPVILLSARAGEESRVEGYETGADDYLVKPFSSTELLARTAMHLRVSKEKVNTDKYLHDVFSQAPFSITIYKGRDMICEFANDVYLEIVKKKRDEFLGKPLFDSLPETKNTLHHIAMNVFDTGEPYHGNEFELTLYRNGRYETCYFNSIWTPLKDGQSKVTGVICYSREVTEQVLARKGN